MSVSPMARTRTPLSAPIATIIAAIALMMLSFAQGAAAQEHPAQSLVEDAVNEAIQVLEAEGDALANDPELLAQRVDEIITPHVDFGTMTKLAVGKFWRRADAAQKPELVTQFKKLLMNTYSGALSEYRGQTISFLPFRPERREDRAVVRSEFNQSGGAGDVPVIYKLRDKGGWKIYDIEVNGISLVTSYRSAFSNEISKGGIAGLLKTLEERNARKS